MKKLNWNEREIHREDGHLEEYAVSRYKNKIMAVVIDFSKDCLEAKLRAKIIAHNKNKTAQVYFYSENYSKHNNFIEYMMGILHLQEKELEKTARSYH